ncbi:MAG: glycosyltransferase family 4 protein [Patescibacteria group bacterium]
MKSTIAVHAKNHAFRLGEGLSRLGILDKIYTIYPKFKIGSYRIPPDEIKSLWFLGGLKYLGRRLGSRRLEGVADEFFDGSVTRALKKPGPDWVFTGYSGYCEQSLLRAKRMGAVTLVERGCPHIDDQEEFMSEERSRLLRRTIPVALTKVHARMKREYKVADYIVVPSNYSLKSFLKRGFPRSRMILTPLSNEKNITFRENKLPRSDLFTVLCVGGHFYRKGIFYLLKAWEQLGLKDARLIVKTEIPEEFGNLRNIPNVEIISHHLPDDAMDGLYGRATIFALPSVDEGFGMVMVEAMRAALPVIVTENVGAADIIQDGREGCVVPIRNPEAIAERIRFFYEHPEKVEEMGRNALETSRDYTPERYAERVVRAYEQVLA